MALTNDWDAPSRSSCSTEQIRRPDLLQRFDREARTAGGLTHPNIVAVYDVGTDNGVPYLVMELIDGTSVAALLASGPLPVGQAVDIARQTCDALAMTRPRVVHRDICRPTFSSPPRAR